MTRKILLPYYVLCQLSEFSSNLTIYSEWHSIWWKLCNFPPNMRGGFPTLIWSIGTILNFFSGSIQKIWTFLNHFLNMIQNSELISEINAEIPNYMRKKHGNSSKSSDFSLIFFFLIRKSPNTPKSIFQVNIRNFLLRVNNNPDCLSVDMMVFVHQRLYYNIPYQIYKENHCNISP